MGWGISKSGLGGNSVVCVWVDAGHFFVHIFCAGLQVANFCLMPVGLSRNTNWRPVTPFWGSMNAPLWCRGGSHNCVCRLRELWEKGGIPVLRVTWGTCLGHSVKSGRQSGKGFSFTALLTQTQQACVLLCVWTCFQPGAYSALTTQCKSLNLAGKAGKFPAACVVCFSFSRLHLGQAKVFWFIMFVYFFTHLSLTYT